MHCLASSLLSRSISCARAAAPQFHKGSAPIAGRRAPASKVAQAVGDRTMASADGTAGGGARTAVDEVGTAGEFKRTPSVFRNKIAKGTRFEPEAGRYHLYISLACPWANRCFAVLNMKGLESAIGVSVTHPTWQRTRPDDPSDHHMGWAFVSPGDPPLPNGNGYGAFPCDAACVPDTVNGVKFVRDLYELAGDQGGKYSVPVLWDKKERTIVNNESSEILRMLNSEFQDCAANPGLDLYPEELRPAIDEVNEWIYPSINNGVYRCGFATGQQAYDAAYADLFAALDRCEGILAKQRYIAGSRLTEADLRLFMTLIRFDHVYIVYFKTNRQFISQFPNLSNYVRDLYQTKGIGESINLDHIKTHYFTSHPRLNYYGIIPPGPPEWWKEEHDRARLSRNVRESKGGLAFEVA